MQVTLWTPSPMHPVREAAGPSCDVSDHIPCLPKEVPGWVRPTAGQSPPKASDKSQRSAHRMAATGASPVPTLGSAAAPVASRDAAWCGMHRTAWVPGTGLCNDLGTVDAT